MGMDLMDARVEYFRFGRPAWEKVLELARCHGWKPAGTALPVPGECPWHPSGDPNWSGTYLVNHGQVVVEVDARGLADALERALPFLPLKRSRPLVVELRPEDFPEGDYHRGYPAGAIVITADFRLDPHEFFAGENRQKVIDFIQYCRRGPFAIW